MERLSFTRHPHDVGETYVKHLGSAWYFSSRMLAAGLACFVHGLFPFLFVRTGSNTVRDLHDRMIKNRTSLPAKDGIWPVTPGSGA